MFVVRQNINTLFLLFREWRICKKNIKDLKKDVSYVVQIPVPHMKHFGLPCPEWRIWIEINM